MCISHFKESEKSGSKQKRGRRKVVYEEVYEVGVEDPSPSPRAKRARRGRK